MTLELILLCFTCVGIFVTLYHVVITRLHVQRIGKLIMKWRREDRESENNTNTIH